MLAITGIEYSSLLYVGYDKEVEILPTCKQIYELATVFGKHKIPGSEMRNSFLCIAITVGRVSAFMLLPSIPVSTRQCQEG